MKGIAIQTVAYLVLAVVALILLWLFFSKTTPWLQEQIKNLTEGFKKWLCEQFGWASWICKIITGQGL